VDRRSATRGIHLDGCSPGIIIMIRSITCSLAVLLFVSSATVNAADDHAAKPAAGPAQAASTPGHGAADAHGADSGHGKPSLIPMKAEEIAEQAPLAIWSFVVFMVLCGIVGKLGWKPIAKAMHDRVHHMEACLHDTEKARNEAEGLLRQYKSEMASASEKIKALLDEARRDAQHTGDEIVRKAQSESELLQQRAHRDISQARDEALIEIWSKAADMSVQVAGKVLQKNLSVEEQNRLVELSAAELPDRSSFGFSTSTGSTR